VHNALPVEHVVYQRLQLLKDGRREKPSVIYMVPTGLGPVSMFMYPFTRDVRFRSYDPKRVHSSSIERFTRTRLEHADNWQDLRTFSWKSLLIRLTIAAKMASSQRPLADKPDDGITDFSDEEEKDMCVIFTLIPLPTIG
jgi:hypothetical protein